MVATFEHIRSSACPACNAAPAAEYLADTPKDATVMLSLPAIHCAGCISGVERALMAVPGVREARVNLTLRRASVQAGPDVTADALAAVLERAGYEAHELDPGALATTDADRAGRDLLMRLAVAFFAMMNVMLLSVAVWSGADGATRDMMHWISGLIAVPAVIFAARPFYVSAWGALRAWRINMDVPITTAMLLALGTSIVETALSGHHAYFDAAVMLCFFLLAGRYLDHRTRAAARSAAQELAALEVPRAILLTPAGEQTVAAGALVPGDHVLVRPGGRIPVDGVVRAGQSELDRSLMTGESLPAFAGPGYAVSAGEVNLTGPLTVEVIAAGRDTALHRIADLVAVAESGRANYSLRAEMAARLYGPGIHLLAAVSAIGWWMHTQDIRLAFNIAAAVLIITCPCALALAVPAVTTAASGRLFRRGLLIKSGTALERLAEVDTVVFDKTGTLTTGTPEPVDLAAQPEAEMRVALALAEGSSHPLAEALARGLRARGLRPATVAALTEVPGYGIEGQWRGHTVRLGRAAWVGAAPLDVTATFLSLGDDAPPRALSFTDTLREGAAETVAALRASGKRVIVISGDTQGAVDRFAARIGIDEVVAEALPQDKLARIKALTDGGARVLMVGDGLNDTAALAAAHVSMSPASALDAARTASDMVLMGRSLAPIAEASVTSVIAARRIRQNFAIAAAYNILAVPLAVAGLCSPLIAALAMSTSSVTVALNAMRLK